MGVQRKLSGWVHTDHHKGDVQSTEWNPGFWKEQEKGSKVTKWYIFSMTLLGIYSALKAYMSKAVLKSRRHQRLRMVPCCPSPCPAAGSEAAGQGRAMDCHPCAWPQPHKAQSDGVTSTAIIPTPSLLGSLHCLNVPCCWHFISLHTVTQQNNPQGSLFVCLQSTTATSLEGVCSSMA